jgi:hypothetical protein
VTQTDSVNERPPVQEGSQSNECDANHDPDRCVGEDQNCEADHSCDDPECSHGAFSHSADAVDIEFTASVSTHDGLSARANAKTTHTAASP